MIERKKLIDCQETIEIGKAGKAPWKQENIPENNGAHILRLRAVGKNDNNEGFVEVSLLNSSQKQTRETFILLTPEEAIALRDTLNSVTW
jgi:hypothetical protein